MNRKLLDAQDLPHQYITGVPPSRRNTASSAIVLRVALSNERPYHFFGDTCYMSKVFWISKTFLKLHHFQVAQNLWLNCSLLLRISACSSVSNTSWIRIFTYVHLLSHLSPGPAGYQEMAFFRGGLTLSRRQQYRRALPTTSSLSTNSVP